MASERTLCLHCGRLTLKGTYCMFCGGELPKEEVTKEEEEVAAPEAELTVAEEKEAAAAPTAEVPAEKPVEEADVQRLIDQLALLNSWRFRLADMVLTRETRADVFTELYLEYLGRKENLEQRRMEELARTSDKVKELSMQLEQLKIRHEVGEVPDKQYITSKLEIDRELSKSKPRLMLLQNPFKIKPADLSEFQSSIVDKIEKFEKEAPSLGVDKQTTSKVVKDLSEQLDSIKKLLEEQKKVKKQIEKLDVKFKIGELREEDYKAQKQRLERELNLE
ncbi:MAG: hypothetical protein ACETVV_02095 [Nitrososphaeria archaeon]